MRIGHALLASIAILTAGEAWASSANAPFRGFVSYNTDEKLGWYSLALNGDTEFLWTNKIAQGGIPMGDGWIRDGKLCGLSTLLYDSKLYAYDYVEVNEATGEILLQQPINTSNFLDYYEKCAYVPQTDRVYGYGWTADGSQMVFKSSEHDFTGTEIIRTVTSAETCASLTFNPETSELIGFNKKSFVRINIITGEQTEIFSPEIPNYQYSFTGLVYDPETGKYYWNVFTKDGVSHFYLVDMNLKKCEKIKSYTNMTQFSFILSTDMGENPNAPVKPEYVSDTFRNGSLSGSVTFRLPSLLGNGTPLSGELSWTASIDGTQVKTGNGAPGSEVIVDCGTMSEGQHSFTMRVTYNGIMSRNGVWNAFIGNDTPSAPANAVLDGTTAKWDAVTTGVNGGYVNPAEITYTVWLNGELQGTTDATSYQIKYPDNQKYTPYQFSVTATFNNKTSEAAVSNIFNYGKALTLPIDLEPTSTDAEIFSFSGSEWIYDDTNAGRENFTTPEGETIDSWLFLPPVAISDKNVLYKLSIRAALTESLKREGQLEVYVGKTPDPAAMKTKVMSPIVLSQSSLKEFTGLFAIAEELKDADQVVIGIRALSENGDYRARMRRFIVSATDIPATVAAAPVIEKISAAPKGELKANLSVKLPSKRMNGEAIPAGTKVKAIVECDLYKATLEGEPGSVQETSIQTFQGENFILAIGQLDNTKGNYARARVYTGAAIPSNVTNLTTLIPANNQSCFISWEAPKEVEGEGYLNPEDISYYYCSYNSSMGTYVPEKNLGHETSYELKAPKAHLLTNINFAIQARSAAGASPTLTGQRIQLGKPYELPVSESFYDMAEGKAKIHYSPYTLLTSGDYAGTSWSVGAPSEIDPVFSTMPDVALRGSGLEGAIGYFELPKFSTSGLNSVKFEVNTFGGENMPSATVWGYSTEHSEYVKVGEISNKTAGYHSETLLLPGELLDEGWVTLFMLVNYQQPGYFLLKSFDISKADGVILPSAESATLISGSHNSIAISVPFATETCISTLDGRSVWNGTVEGEINIEAAPGIYVVSTPYRTVKVVVK